MTTLTWGQPGDRVYESGLDRGVLYLSDGSAVPWNGLVSVNENSNRSRREIHYDGQKIGDLITPGDFTGTLKAITYPDEFYEYEGLANIAPGVYAPDQKSKTFGLSYRTFVNNDQSPELGYKINVIYNVMATPTQRTHNTHSKDTSLMDFEWDLTAVPEEYPGIRPTAHLIFDSRTMDAEVLAELEAVLYGDETTDALLISFEELMVLTTVLIRIVDNGDGTWTASTRRSGLISVVGDEFEILDANSTMLTADKYTISDTLFH